MDANARVSNESVSVVYPNPSAGAFTFLSDVAAKYLIVTDANGLVVYENKAIDNTVPLQFGSELRHGIYILKVVTDEGVTNTRLIKN